MVQVFQNLIDNALVHSSADSTVTIEAMPVEYEKQAWIECFIRDSGPGFRPEDLSRIFEPFFTRRLGGTGLGLSIAQRIVEAHGGHIFASNRPEGGAVICIRFPLSGTNSSKFRPGPI
jgi:signal transduction histidine kinase